MSSIKIIIFPAILLLAIFVGWRYTIPSVKKAFSLALEKKPELEENIQKEIELHKRIDKLAREIEKNTEDTAKTYSAVPRNKEIKNFVSQVESIAVKEGMILKAIKVEDSESERLSGRKKVEGSEIGKKLKGDAEIEGGYGQFKNLLTDFKKLERINDIRAISVTNVSDVENTVTGKYIIEFEIFWQPSLNKSELKQSSN